MNPEPKGFMTIRTLSITLLSGFFIAACGGGPDKVISGKYSLFELPADRDAPDAIEFRPGGSCLIDSGERTGILGKYRASANGRLKIAAESGMWKDYTCKYELHKITLVLDPDEETSLIYVRLPEGPHPEFTEILGTFFAHTDLGDSAGEITADHKFRDHLRYVDHERHTYEEAEIDGKCTYADGVVTYLPEKSDAPQQEKYMRDFIVKRDAKGLWLVDPFHDEVICQTPVTDLSLPPPPDGYGKETVSP
jgi:hypothetical protein